MNDYEAELHRKIDVLRKALKDLIDAIGGHDHWDETHQRGLNCIICIQQRNAKETARQILEATK